MYEHIIDAAEIVIREAGQPLHYTDITAKILARGRSRLSGLTPERTVNSILSKDLENSNPSRFRRWERGRYGLSVSSSEGAGVESPPQAVTHPAEVQRDQNDQAEFEARCFGRYQREKFAYYKLIEVVEGECWNLLNQKEINAQVTSRVKGPASFVAKLKKYLDRTDEREKLKTPEDVFKRITDLAGVRIITYIESDRQKVSDLLSEAFIVTEKDVKDKKVSDGKFYRATHCQVELRPETQAVSGEQFPEMSCEIQICSMLAHVWNEIEHDLAYKPSDNLSDSERDLLKALGHQTLAGDLIISQLIEMIALRRSAPSQ